MLIWLLVKDVTYPLTTRAGSVVSSFCDRLRNAATCARVTIPLGWKDPSSKPSTISKPTAVLTYPMAEDEISALSLNGVGVEARLLATDCCPIARTTILATHSRVAFRVPHDSFPVTLSISSFKSMSLFSNANPT
ncbi:hypothetical protein D3C73_524570 [compost metagenome]